MKHSQKLLLKRFPEMEHISEPRNAREKVFFDLYEFLVAPEKNHYDLQALMKEAEAEDVHFFLEVLYTYFEKDTYLPMKPPKPLVIRENQKQVDYLSQTELSAFLIKEGHDTWKPNKVTTYYGRGKLPEPDVIISGKPYWSNQTARRFSNYLSNPVKGATTY
jgi:hypothetical protein